MESIVAIDSPPTGISDTEKVTLRDIIMGIRDPCDPSKNMFQEVWTGVSDNKIHFVVMTDQEPTTVECIDILRQIVAT